jgi:hypothetical protein
MWHLASKVDVWHQTRNRPKPDFPALSTLLDEYQDRCFNSQWIISTPQSIAKRYRKLAPILLDAYAKFRFAGFMQSAARMLRFCLRRVDGEEPSAVGSEQTYQK